MRLDGNAPIAYDEDKQREHLEAFIESENKKGFVQLELVRVEISPISKCKHQWETTILKSGADGLISYEERKCSKCGRTIRVSDTPPELQKEDSLTAALREGETPSTTPSNVIPIHGIGFTKLDGELKG